MPTEIITVTGVPVEVTVVGNVSQIIRVSIIPTITGGAYTANQAVGGLMEFPNCVLASGRGGILQVVKITDDAGQNAALDLLMFDRTFTPTADQSTIAILEADAENTLGVVSISAGNYARLGATVPSVATRAGLGLAFKLNGTSIFAQLVTRGAPTYVATDDLTVTLAIIPD